MIHIIGDGIIEQAKAFNDVKKALEFDCDVYLGAMWCNLVGHKLTGKVIYNMEPLYDESKLFSVAGYMEILRNNIILDFSKKNIEYLKTKGIEAFHLPYGYHPYLERVEQLHKTIDVLFVGTEYYPRRSELFNKLSRKCKFVSARGYYEKELDQLIGKAKVHLNLHHYDANQPLEVVRLNYLMANHCNVVTEFGNDEEVNQKYQGIRMTDYDSLMDSCLEALEVPMDGYEVIKKMPQDCKKANEWLRSKL